MQIRNAIDWDELDGLWNEGQGGAARDERLRGLVEAVGLPASGSERVLDLCCGTGDLGRRVRALHPDATVESLDRDPYLLRVCRALDARAGVRGVVHRRDLRVAGWSAGLQPGYRAIVASTALHYLDRRSLTRALAEARTLLAPHGVLGFSEPVRHTGRELDWSPEAWNAFWERSREHLGYDHLTEVHELAVERVDSIGDDGLSAGEWRAVLLAAGYRTARVAARNPGHVTFVAR